MSVLTLRLAGPLQSWGAASRFTLRKTESAPTKSGVVGLLAAAVGIERGDDARLAPLTGLRFGVRVDQPGTRLRDFHTAHHGVTGGSMPLTERFYLADAVFVAAVEGELALLSDLYAGLKAPVFPPFLGRRSCPPAEKIELGLHEEGGLEDVLREVPWQASPWYRRRRRHRPPERLDVLIEKRPDDSGSAADMLRDQPLSFAAEHRRHALRTVVTTTVPLPVPPERSAPSGVGSHHDPFEALEDEGS